jgi:hypothetical protein
VKPPCPCPRCAQAIIDYAGAYLGGEGCGAAAEPGGAGPGAAVSAALIYAGLSLAGADPLSKAEALRAAGLLHGISVTDWVTRQDLLEEYPDVGLTEEQADRALAAITPGRFHEHCVAANAGSENGRRRVLDVAVAWAAISGGGGSRAGGAADGPDGEPALPGPLAGGGAGP